MQEESVVHARRVRRDSADALLGFAEALARIAAGGGGPQALAGHLASVLDAAVLIEDAEWRHLALAGTGDRSVPPSVRELLPRDTSDAADGVSLGAPADARALFGWTEPRLPDGWHGVFTSEPKDGTRVVIHE